ncbi:Bis(5'-adenosyl)-triphosphatase [Cyberlindnera fabianii]|uniref:Bis(5'-adenosyl)-triphosphatase n=1 Tax=Cyberlindnera fabianii TaxID=36022 RepID=A0A1V2LBD6_CYBFA|nr:Bis(5'-adenosyl)-triphosphatase [Cyberlindnera fabianii]
MTKQAIKFSNFVVNDQKSKYTYALVNLKPIVPGHVLIVPLRHVQRLKELTPEENVDYMSCIQQVHQFIEKVYKADSLNIAIQDGPEAGQSVPHLHTHVIPRHKENNMGDKIYELLDSEEFDIDKALKDFYIRKTAKKQTNYTVKPDADRFPRTAEVMKKEAEWLRSEYEKFSGEKLDF